MICNLYNISYTMGLTFAIRFLVYRGECSIIVLCTYGNSGNFTSYNTPRNGIFHVPYTYKL